MIPYIKLLLWKICTDNRYHGKSLSEICGNKKRLPKNVGHFKHKGCFSDVFLRRSSDRDKYKNGFSPLPLIIF